MRKTILLFILLFSSLEIYANSLETIDSSKNYSKPGAPIDIKFNIVKTDINITSDVNITLSTTVNSGDLNVQTSLDKHLISSNKIEKNLNFKIEKERKKFFINFKVKSQKQGLFYIRLLTHIDTGHSLKLRSFAIPIYVGKKSKSLVRTNVQMKALANGENISISKAVETIKVIK